MTSSNSFSKGMAYAVNISFFVIGIPFMVFSLSFPILLIVMGFMSKEEETISAAYIWIYALIGLIIYGEFIFMKGMIKRFLKYHGVSSLREYYALNFSREAKEVKKAKQTKSEERVSSLFDNLEVIEFETRKRALEQEKYVTADPSHVPFLPITQSSSSRFETFNNVMVFFRAAAVVLIPTMVINGLLMYFLGMPIIELMWTFLFVEGMLLSFVGTGAGIHQPKTDEEERKGLLVFFVGRRGMEMNKKMFILSLGGFTVLLSLLMFATIGELPNF
ncbi:MAG: hypothetical protein ACTSYA_09510 [Candidatus Kariarchaeaceae archaeon]